MACRVRGLPTFVPASISVWLFGFIVISWLCRAIQVQGLSCGRVSDGLSYGRWGWASNQPGNDTELTLQEILSMIYYFAYGSNLHPVRLIERVPSARLIGVATLAGYRLVFHKKSHDGSSKCNMFETNSAADVVYGAIYEIAPEHKGDLDRFEGNGFGYTDNPIKLSHQAQEYLCFTYLAQPSHIVEDLKPYHWYKDLVLLGAKHLGFPDTYVASIDCVESAEDQDHTRRLEIEVLLEKMLNGQNAGRSESRRSG